MTAIMPPPETSPSSAFEPLLRIWMMPAQIGLELMESSLAMMTSALPPVRETVEKGQDQLQDIARAAEEQAAHLDDGPDTVILPAAVIA